MVTVGMVVSMLKLITEEVVLPPLSWATTVTLCCPLVTLLKVLEDLE